MASAPDPYTITPGFAEQTLTQVSLRVFWLFCLIDRSKSGSFYPLDKVDTSVPYPFKVQAVQPEKSSSRVPPSTFQRRPRACTKPRRCWGEMRIKFSSVGKVFQPSPHGAGLGSSAHTTAQRRLTRRTPTQRDDPPPLQEQAISRGWPSAPTRLSQRADLNPLRMASASPDAPASRDRRPGS